MPEAISLYQFNQYIKQVIDVNFDEPIWVRCELASIRHNKGHVYLELVENNAVSRQVVAQMSAVIWAGDYLRISGKMNGQINQILRQGAEVQLQVDLSYHERYGLKMNVRDVDLYFTLGQLEMQRRDILTRLQKEDRIDRNKKNILPTVVQRIAIISSPGAAGYLDFIAHIEKNPAAYGFHYRLYSATMQGEQVSRDISRHLYTFQPGEYDAVVIIRGGGSKLDLADFDAYELGVAISECALPVITGIGHEIDVSIADLLAHTSCKTPTAVADFLITRMRNFDQLLGQWYADLERSTQQRLTESKRKMQQWEQDLRWHAKHLLLRQSEWLHQMAYQTRAVSMRRLDIAREQLTLYEKSIELLDFTKVLSRGFAVASNSNGQILKSVAHLHKGDQLRITLSDGTIHSIIQEIQSNV